MLCVLFATLLIAGVIVCGVRIVRTLRAQKSRGKLLLFVILTVCAVAVGIRYGVLHVFPLSERLRLQGIPITLVLFVWEEDRWTPFETLFPIAYYFIAANVLAPVLLVWSAWLLAARLWRLKVRGGSKAPQSPSNTNM
jgi:hypothetical protein